MAYRSMHANYVGESEEEVYCICRRPEDGKMMIACDGCEEWFHGDCVNMTKEEADQFQDWYCTQCKKKRAQKFRRIETSKVQDKPTPTRQRVIAQAQAPAPVVTSPLRNTESAAGDASFAVSETQQDCLTCKRKKASQGSRFCSQECLRSPPGGFLFELGVPPKIQNQNIARKIKQEPLEVVPLRNQFACGGCEKWPMLTPIFQCQAGHSICSPCSLILTACAICRAKLPDQKIRAPAVEALQPPLTKCSQQPVCRVVFANQADMKKHLENECHFSKKLPICQFLGLGSCEVVCSVGDEAADHLENHHKATVEAPSAEGITEQIVQFKSGKSAEPRLTCVKFMDAIVVVQETKKLQRRQLRVFAFGNHLELQKLTLFVETKVAPAVDQLFAGINIKHVHRSRSTMKLMAFNCKSSDAYKALYTFDTGLESMGCDLVWRISRVG